MNLNAIVTLVGEASSLKNALLALPRIKNGPLTARSKREVERLLRRFQDRVQTLGISDPVLQVVLAEMADFAADLAGTTSNNNGGYPRIVYLFSMIVARMGYV